MAYVGLGANLGDRAGALARSLELLAGTGGVRLLAVSSCYETEPVGYLRQPDFLNLVAKVETNLSPRQLLNAMLAVEADLGRQRGLRWGPRTIDLDLLLYGDVTLNEPGLVIPHPRMAESAFVLVPLLELWPDAVLPDGQGLSERWEAIGPAAGQGVRRLAAESARIRSAIGTRPSP